VAGLNFRNSVALVDKKNTLKFKREKQRAYAYVSAGSVYWFIFW
jgi:hypothetical protein